MLVKLDPSDYRNTIEQRKSELQQARSDLKLEMGRQDIARKEYELLDETLNGENKSLVLRKPQLQAARSRVESAKASLNQARLDLERTSIEAPFDAKILSREVNVGSQVAPGDHLARLVGMDTYWVETTVPLSKVQWLSFHEDSKSEGSLVRVRNASSWPGEEYRKGRLYKLVGNVDEEARMAKVLVSVTDPLARATSSSDSPSLIIGSFVETNIRGKRIPNVVRLNRDYVREDDRVWVMEKGKLDIRDVEIVFRDRDYAYVKDGLNAEDSIVTTNLSTVVEGAALRTESTKTARKESADYNTGDTSNRTRSGRGRNSSAGGSI